MPTTDLPSKIEAALAEHGPLSGAGLQQIVPADPLVLWRACKRSAHVIVRPLGQRFLRLDRSVEDYARLSPSIRREFLTYSVVGFRQQEPAVEQALNAIRERAKQISENKRRLAESTMAACLDELPEGRAVAERACFIMAGDVVYGLAHDVARPESSTGQLVRGSDLDIIIVTADDMDPDTARRLDDLILKKKHYLLVHPDLREEIDYVLKPLARVREQVKFDVFEHMVACKILHEGQYLLGSRAVFDEVKRLLKKAAVPEKLAAMQQAAERERQEAEGHLLAVSNDAEARQKYLHLFYTREESEEIY
jgi:hypothetical protein